MRIADEYLNCSIYLYPSYESAESGRWAGGSGFLVHSQWCDDNGLRAAMFVVTNRHVIHGMKGKDPHLRVNLKSGGRKVLRTNLQRWVHHPENDDISAYEFLEFEEDYDLLALREQAFLRKETVEQNNIGIGDQIAMIGRLVEHDGKVRNSPCVRFGSISMMPGEGLEAAFRDDRETFLVDCWSLAGFSGSPVIVFMPHQARGTQALLNAQSWVLGVNWMHVAEKIMVQSCVLDKSPYVSTNTGVAGVIPAWRIRQLLDSMKSGVT